MRQNDSDLLKNVIYIIISMIVFIYVCLLVYILLDFTGLLNISDKYSIAKTFSNIKTISKDIGENEDKKDSFEQTNYSNLNGLEDFTYYNKINKYSQIIYKAIVDNSEKMKSGTYIIEFGKQFNDLLNTENGEETIKDAFNLAINALNYDKPELFYIDVSKLNLFINRTTNIYGTTYKVEIGPIEGENYFNKAFNSKEEIDMAIINIEKEKNIIKSKLNGSIENKIKIVHDYLVDNIEYDITMSKDNIYDIYGGLVNKKVVCEGYAQSFKYLMDDLKIPCIIVRGIGINKNGQTQEHAWNYVKIQNEWYAIDLTWDDPITFGNANTKNKYNYYLKGSKDFFVDHIESKEYLKNTYFKYPKLSIKNYIKTSNEKEIKM